MCKILAISGIPTDRRAQRKAEEFLRAAKTYMCRTDRDGFGYALLQSDGQTDRVWGEKWVDPAHAFKDRHTMAARVQRYKDDIGADVLDLEENDYHAELWGSSMTPGLPTRAILAHARMATCGISIENTHPFFDRKSKTVLVHNGVISNHADIPKRLSTCDSEAILTSYNEHDVQEYPARVQKMVDALTGSFACAVLTKDGDTWAVDVFKNADCTLFCAYVPYFRAYVFATTAEIIRGACRVAKLQVYEPRAFRPNTLIRLDALTGKRLNTCKFTHNPVPFWAGRDQSQSYLDKYTGYLTTIPPKEQAK